MPFCCFGFLGSELVQKRGRETSKLMAGVGKTGFWVGNCWVLRNVQPVQINVRTRIRSLFFVTSTASNCLLTRLANK